MRSASPLVLALASVFMWVACDTEQPTALDDLGPSYLIADATNELGFPNFFWLPPIAVKAPQTTGTFSGVHNPIVLICEGWVGPEDGCSPEGDKKLKKYTMKEGDDDEKVLVDIHGQHYHLNWDTDLLGGISQSGEYRIAVWLYAELIGYADVLIDKNAQTFQHDGTTAELIEGRTIPIKFRIEAEICSVRPGACIEIWGLAFHRLTGLQPFSFDVFLATTSAPNREARLTFDANMDGMPSWSPDGNQIAFVCGRQATSGAIQPAICVMNADGTGERIVTQGNVWGIAGAPAWSPDGDWIVYQGRTWLGGPPEGFTWSWDRDLYMVPAGANNDISPTQLTFTDPPSDNPACATEMLNGDFLQLRTVYEEWDPVWTPDGRITYAKSHVSGGHGSWPDGWEYNEDCTRAWHFGIFSLDPSAPTTETPLTNVWNWDQDSPAWSPDREYLLYSATPSPDDNDSGVKALWAMNVSTGNTTQLTFPGVEEEDQEADFSPDGTRILFTRYAEDESGNPVLTLYLAGWNPSGPALIHPVEFTDGGWGRWR